MGFRQFYAERVLPVVIDKACASPGFTEPRAAVVADTHGTVLEIGFGSGHNLRHLGRDLVHSASPHRPSPDDLAAALRRPDRLGDSRLDFRQGLGPIGVEIAG